MLSYSKFDITWECSSGFRYEHDPTPHYNRNVWYERYSKGLLRGLEKNIREASPDGYFFIWCMAVRLYSEKNLTVKTDRLAAISGIANVFRRTYKATPLPGLWLEDLHRGLLWFRAQKNPCHPQDGQRVPTWSWVSIDSPICYFGPHHFGTADRTLSSVKRLRSPYDADIVGTKTTKFKMHLRKQYPSVHLYIWGLLRKGQFTAHPKPEYCGAVMISVKRYNGTAYLSGILDTDIPLSNSIYCLRIATWGYEVSTGYRYPNRHSVRMGYYLLLERRRLLRRPQHPSDWGKFR